MRAMRAMSTIITISSSSSSSSSHSNSISDSNSISQHDLVLQSFPQKNPSTTLVTCYPKRLPSPPR